MARMSKVLLVGSGGVGTIAAVNLEAGGKAEVTAVLRSNFEAVKQNGFIIVSCDHGRLTGWRPTHVVSSIPQASGNNTFDYVVVVTKNVPDCPPTVVDVIKSAITPRITKIVLIQNGLNIEKPILAAFPENICLSGISLIQSHELSHGVIQHDLHDTLQIGAFHNPNLDKAVELAAAQHFIEIYSAAGKTTCEFVDDILSNRWRKLIYNACLNSICAVTGMDTGRLQLANVPMKSLVRPAMEEVKQASIAAGAHLPDDIIDWVIANILEPIDMYFEPSMLVDVKKGNLMELENIVGEPLRTGTSLGVSMPILYSLYHLLKAVQFRTMVNSGRIIIPPKGNYLPDN